MRSELPTGTVTFLFTDIEGSTRLLQDVGEDVFAQLLEQHNEIVRDAVQNHGGVEIRTEGDAFFVVFRSALEAVGAAADALLAFNRHGWPAGSLLVRMGAHTGTARLGGDNYLGLDVHRAARISDAAHGGQLLVSQDTASTLHDQLGPDIGLLDLGEFKLKDVGGERLYQVTAEGLPREFPPPRSLGSMIPRLPEAATEFIGREDEIESLLGMVSPGSLVTLTGAGGTGKTRLALDLAHRLTAEYPDEAVFVALSGTSDAELVASAILKTLGLQTSSTEIGPEDHLVSYLGERQMLLVLDNFEHVVEAKPLVSRIHSSCPGVAMIVTSRVPLRVADETEVMVPPLGTDDLGSELSDANRLFLHRAKAVRPGYEPSEHDLSAIAELTHRLDGLPLAIELAASRLRVLSPDQILARLDNQLLSSRTEDLPSRQRTINATIGWSFDLLTAPARRLFARMSSFVGGAALEELDRVCRDRGETDIDVLDNLGELIDHSLIREVVVEGATRFAMLHVVREFAYEQLIASSEEAEYRHRHMVAFGEIVDAADSEFQTLARLKWLDRLSAEHDNIRAALDWAVSTGDAESALRMAAGMWRYWQTRGPLPEAQERVTQALSISGGNPVIRAHALEAAGGIAYWRGDFESMTAPYREAVEILRQHGTPSELALALYNLSFGMIALSDYAAAADSLDESMEISKAEGDALGMARAHWGRFDLAWYQQDTDEAQRHARLAVDGFETVDAPFDLGWAYFALGDTQVKLAELDEARVSLSKGLPVFAEAADLPALLLFLGDFAALEFKAGNRERAAHLTGAVQAIREKIGINLFDTIMWDQPHKEVRDLFGDIDDDLRGALEGGHKLSPSEAVDLALSGPS